MGSGSVIRIRGLRRVQRNLNFRIRFIQGRTDAGVYEAARYILRASDTKVPVLSGELVESGYLRPIKSIHGTAIGIGYAAVYALAVHENPLAGQLGHKNKATHSRKRYAESGEWKFLEHAAQESRRMVIEIIRKRASV